MVMNRYTGELFAPLGLDCKNASCRCLGSRKEVENPIASTDQSRVQLNPALIACFGLITLSGWIVSCKPMELPPSQPQSLKYRTAPADNPLKGFMPFRGDYRDAFPHSMEWDYFPLRDLMTGPENFDFEVVERSLAEVAARGHQLVMRVYLDYPEKSTGVPQFLIDEGVKMRPYEDHGGGLSPDYEDERLVQAVEKFIAAFGIRYDGDPRLGFPFSDGFFMRMIPRFRKRGCWFVAR
jgi:hypothetical protein